MKAIVCRKYGPPDVLSCEEVEKPIPKDDEVLIRVRAASVNPVDRLFHGKPYVLRLMTGLRKPKVPRVGTDVAGQVEAVGRNVTQFKPGDEVFGVCKGAFAEYACTSEARLAVKPANVSYEQAASAPVAALTALQALRDKGQIQPGQKVLINGASGGVGTFAVQIAKSLGADVTAVCSTRNVEIARSIGADRVIDYGREDFTKSGQRYDVVFDLVSNHSLSAYRSLLSSTGTCVIGGAKNPWRILTRAAASPVLSRVFSERFVVFIAKAKRDDLNVIGELMGAGKITPIIDKRYRLNEVPDAIRYLEEGHAQGKIVVSLE